MKDLNENNEHNEHNNIEKIDIIDSAERCFLNYGMSVITDRALPDVRDGLKPVHRRILWSQYELGNKPTASYKKCARIVGDVIGKYHPHGDASVYEAMVRMAQNFSMRLELVDGQGNFGSIDGDNAAAMRYTEARMTNFSNSMFEDMPFNTVNMVANYDGQEFMPEVLPLKYPNLLVNGTQGIAVGMACNLPPHNPIEVMNCLEHIIVSRLKNEEVEIADLIKLMPCPDFPTGGLIHNLKNMEEIWATGRGNILLRSKWFEEESETGNPVIIINEIPYQINKEKMLEKITALSKPDKKKGGKIEFEEIKLLRDESDEEGIRIYIELKKDCEAELFFNKLLKKTDLEVSISYNANVLVNGQPKLIGIKDILDEFIKHRLSVISKRTEYLDISAAKKEHLLKGLVKALSNIDAVIRIIKESKNTSEAKSALEEYFEIDSLQSQSIVDMRLHKLTTGEVSDIEMDLSKIEIERQDYKEILNSEERRFKLVLEETVKQTTMIANSKIKGVNRSKRLTDFEYNKLDTDLAELTKKEDCTILFTNDGYLRRVPVSEFENQNRGTRGKKFMKLKEKDFIVKSINSHSHDVLMLVTEKGKVYSLNAYELKDNLSGRHINNILKIDKEDKVLVILSVGDYSEESKNIIMVTEKGMVKKSKLSDYSNSFRRSGLLGIKLKEDDKIISAETCTEEDKVMLVNDKNNIIIFETEQLRELQRKSQGVSGMTIGEDGKLIGAGIIVKGGLIVTVSENGMIKITNADEYKTQKRNGKGVKVFKENEKTGMLFKAMSIFDLNQDIIVTTKLGISNRISLDTINITKRTTSGVKLIKLDDKDELADSFIVVKSNLDDEDSEVLEYLDDSENVESDIFEDEDNEYNKE